LPPLVVEATVLPPLADRTAASGPVLGIKPGDSADRSVWWERLADPADGSRNRFPESVVRRGVGGLGYRPGL
jgi:hypothetical protein